MKRNQPPALYFCRHDQFATSRAREMLPIQPNWLVEALGTLEIDPNLHHDGPYPDKDNRVQIRTILDMPDGQKNMKVTVIDAVSAWVMEQRIYDGRGQLRAKIRRRELSPRSKVGTLRADGRASGMPAAAILDAYRPRRRAGKSSRSSIRRTLGAAEHPGAPLVDLGNPNVPIGPPPGVAVGR